MSSSEGQNRDSNYQASNQSNVINIRFIRLFDDSERSDRFYEEICTKLKQIQVYTSIDSDEQIIDRDRIMFKLSFTVTYSIDGNPQFYLSRVKKIINQLPYTISSNKPGQNVITKTEYPAQPSVVEQISNHNPGYHKPKKTKMSNLSKILNPHLFTILPVTAFMIFVAYILMTGDGKNNSDRQQSNPSQITAPKTSNSSGGQFRFGEKNTNPQQ
jgi:hypothetical protein